MVRSKAGVVMRVRVRAGVGVGVRVGIMFDTPGASRETGRGRSVVWSAGRRMDGAGGHTYTNYTWPQPDVRYVSSL